MYYFWSFFLKKRSFSYLFIAALVVFGSAAVFTIPKENAPEVKVPIAIVSTILPGATAETVEKLVTNKIEDAIANLEDIKSITSTSREGISGIVVEFDAKADIETSVQDLKNEVDTVAPQLPNEAEDSTVTKLSFVDQPVLTVAISGDLPAPEFFALADSLERELKALAGVSDVHIAGKREREVQVIVSKEALATYGLTLSQVTAAIAGANTTLPIGSITVNDIEYNVEFASDVTDPSEIADLAILSTPNGSPIYVRDVAFVSDSFEKTRTFSRISIDGSPSENALSFNIFAKSGGDITDVSAHVRAHLTALQEPGSLLEGVTVLVVFDAGEFLKRDLLTLVFSGLQTVALVMIILFLTIGWREALVAGAAIPLSFLIAFIALEATGNTINFVSLFSLILAVGILVDSAIVIVEGIHTRMKLQMDKKEAAYETIKEFYLPLTSGTLTTVAVFAPLFLISGITGEFIASIPFTIIFVLMASLLVALGFIPLIASIVLRRRNMSRLEESQEQFTSRLQKWYRNVLDSFLENRKKQRTLFISLSVAFVVALSFPIVGVVPVIFFPQEDIDFIVADVEMPQGSILERTDFEARKVEEILYEEPAIDSFVTTVGQASSFGLEGGTTEKRFANVFINLRTDRSDTSTEIVNRLRESTTDIHTAKVSVSQPSNGPPGGAPVSISFLGDNLDDLDRVAKRAAQLLESIPGTADVATGARNSTTEFVLTIDKAKATELGLDPRTVAETLRTAVYGTTATTIKNQEGDIDVVVRLDLNADFINPHDTNRATIDDIRQLAIETARGPILLGSVLTGSIKKGNPTIAHDDRKRVTTVTAQLAEGGNALAIVSEFQDRIAELSLGEGIVADFGGENEDVQQSFQDMFYALIIGMLSMFAILVLQFNSFRHAGYVLSIVPLALIGIFAGLAITGKALSFPSIMGFIALAGIVVNNSIILIDVINTLRAKNDGVVTKEIIITGATARLRPILLTALTTVIGITPLIFAAELWAPLAFSIMFGLTFSVIITLLLIPVIYYRWPGNVSRE
ncbi:hypothetical protein COU17_00400 [Candidatus Kaiserbacteria bacterium CG10_big_fil_rev_8_21_14_0_10_49_17]|uniref:AcrB/AcrD/AcrF family protein n=1 Tax=Candidatus Kaiserbacteria bacterium CG10_big_fil_rev_8_21_14_0_10_49_17 TaxID=1974609 RepID=A0A2M6WF79_9BACT|nr:MAG: hypothetical protein COU17_00400 [Candidatus Kaiserbacteria bacterium CG10_big_fil_rev_8_21_14_0_10_49_17]